MDASVKFPFHDNIWRGNQKVEQAGVLGHNHWNNFIFVVHSPPKIHSGEEVLPVFLTESSATQNFLIILSSGVTLKLHKLPDLFN